MVGVQGLCSGGPLDGKPFSLPDGGAMILAGVTLLVLLRSRTESDPESTPVERHVYQLQPGGGPLGLANRLQYVGTAEPAPSAEE